MKTLLAVAAIATVMSIGATEVQAGDRDPRVNTRQHHQHARSRQGVQSGELTRPETRKLAEEQRDVRQLERAYKSDGTLTRAERGDLRHEQNQASRDIYRQKHDSQER